MDLYARIQEYLEKLEYLQSKMLKFLDEDISEDYDNLVIILNNLNITKKKYELKIFSRLLLILANHHHRSPNFYDKIDKILLFLKDDILNQFTSNEIYKLFKNNKRIILFLIKEKVINVDDTFVNNIKHSTNKTNCLDQYFKKELSEFENKEKSLNTQDEEDDNLFEMKRLAGENDNYLAQMIQNDSINEFIIYANQNNLPLSSQIIPSIYETNALLQSTNPTLIEYSAFFGSIQIFKYLLLNGCNLDQKSWKFAIHGNNPEIIHLLEEKNITIFDKRSIVKESIQCHHNEIANYFINNFSDFITNDSEVFINSIKFSNYAFFPHDLDCDEVFFELCKYDYVYFVRILLSDGNININTKNILKLFTFS